MGEDRPSSPGHVHTRVLSHGCRRGAMQLEGLCSGLLCLSFPTESDSRGLAVALTLRQRLSLGEPARGAQASCPVAPAPAMTRAPGYGEAALHAASCRLLPSAARGRQVSRLLIQHEPPPRPPHPPWGRWQASVPPRLPHGRTAFALASPLMVGDFFPPSCGDPPGFPALAAHPWGFCRSYRNIPPARRLRGRLGVMPPCAGCLAGTNRGLPSVPSCGCVPGCLVPGTALSARAEPSPGSLVPRTGWGLQSIRWDRAEMVPLAQQPQRGAGMQLSTASGPGPGFPAGSLRKHRHARRIFSRLTFPTEPQGRVLAWLARWQGWHGGMAD